jgi:hypothetical protein
MLITWLDLESFELLLPHYPPPPLHVRRKFLRGGWHLCTALRLRKAVRLSLITELRADLVPSAQNSRDASNPKKIRENTEF